MRPVMDIACGDPHHNGRDLFMSPALRGIDPHEVARNMVLPSHGYTTLKASLVAAHMDIAHSTLYNLLDDNVPKYPFLVRHVARLTNATREAQARLAPEHRTYHMLIAALNVQAGFCPPIELPNDAHHDEDMIIQALAIEIQEH